MDKIIRRQNGFEFNRTRTVAIGLYNMLEKSLVNKYFSVFCAGGIVVAIPISILFVIMQKYYVEGVTGGSVKG